MKEFIKKNGNIINIILGIFVIWYGVAYKLTLYTVIGIFFLALSIYTRFYEKKEAEKKAKMKEEKKALKRQQNKGKKKKKSKKKR